MTGSHRIIVQNSSLKFDFTIRRNITILQGNSATGKTTLVEMVCEHYERGEDSGVEVLCDKPCTAIGGRDWGVLLEAHKDSIIFIDEGNDFVLSDDFARAVEKSDNYYVIVTREGLPNLPYSTEEIYGIHMSGKYGGLKPVYNEFYRIYGRQNYTGPVTPETVVVEDFAESSRYFSWERYFTDLLTRQTQGTYLQYKKSSLNPTYLTDSVRKDILAVLEQIELTVPEDSACH